MLQLSFQMSYLRNVHYVALPNELYSRISNNLTHVFKFFTRKFWLIDPGSISTKINHIIHSPFSRNQKITSVFSAVSNIQDGDFCENYWQLSALTYFRKKIRLISLTGFWTYLWKCFTNKVNEKIHPGNVKVNNQKTFCWKQETKT